MKGNNSVDNALGGYLKKERLEGDNQYFCETCNSKQDALIYTQLSKLPEVATWPLTDSNPKNRSSDANSR